MTSIGERVRPKNWEAITSGTFAYTGDVHHEGLLVGAILRSPIPLGDILEIDTSAAAAMDGVHAVVTAEEIAGHVPYIHVGGDYSDRHPLATDRVRFVGQEVAAVAAESAARAREAVAAIRVRYRQLRAPTTLDEALAPGAEAIHERKTGQRNVSLHSKGEWGAVDLGREMAARSVSGTFEYARAAHACMEQNKTVAHWDPVAERLQMWTSTQAPWFVVTEVARALALEERQVVCRDIGVGGGFGSKSKICDQEVIAAALSMRSGRPVSVALSRDEEFATTKTRHAFRVKLTTSADRDGRICLFETDVLSDNGAYNHYGPLVLKAGIKALGLCYRPLGVQWESRLVDTALPPGGQFRGYGQPQVVFALESQIDQLAEQFGVDPLEFRLRNATPPHTTSLSGARLGGIKLRECLEVARDEIGWERHKRERQADVGIGVAVGHKGSGVYLLDDSNRSDAAIDLFPDGRIRVRYGSADAGTGQRTILAQVAAEELGVSVDDVDVQLVDSDETPFDMGAWSCRGTHMGGHAVAAAATAMAARLRSAAEEKLKAGQVTLGDGRARAGSESLTFSELFGLLEDAQADRVTEEASYVDPDMERAGPGSTQANLSPNYTSAAHAARVHVDRATGRVRLLDYVAAHDAGRPLNPAMVEGQIIGGVSMGVGAALGEELIYEEGRLVNGAYIDYALPRANDLPQIRPFLVGDDDDQEGPYGAKSIGELPLVPSAPAIANAVYDAVGVRITELPITPDKVLRALREQEGHRHRHRLWRRPDRWQIALFRWLYPKGLHLLLHRVGTRFARSVPAKPVERVSRPQSVEDATRHAGGSAAFIGGGTDLLRRREERLVDCTELVATQDIPELTQCERLPTGGARIGGAVTLADLEDALPTLLPGVPPAALRTIATPQVRAVATVAGNLLQDKRCWFYRSGFQCYKRGGKTCPCYAVQGDHRFYHAAMGAHRCQAVTPSDLASIFLALDATVEVCSAEGSTSLPVARLYTGPGESRVRADQLVTAVTIPPAAQDRLVEFHKLSLWSGDFAVVSAAVAAEPAPGPWRSPRVVLGALAPVPWRATKTERRLGRDPVDPAAAEDVLHAELERAAHPLAGNGWKVDAAAGVATKALQALEARRLREPRNGAQGDQ